MIKKHVFFTVMIGIAGALYGVSEEDCKRVTAAWHELHKQKPVQIENITQEDFYNFGRSCFYLNFEHEENTELKNLYNHLEYHYNTDRSAAVAVIVTTYLMSYSDLSYWSGLVAYLGYSMMSNTETYALFVEYGKNMFGFIK